jgi:hypothetical protein
MSNSLICPFTNYNLLAPNINFDTWQKMIKSSTLINKKKLYYFLCNTKEEYIKLIIDNKDKPDILKYIFIKYKENQRIEQEKIKKEEEEKKLKLFLDSVYNITKDTNHPIILIRLLSGLDEENAIELYTFYKTYTEEFNDDDEIKDFIDDFIYGIFEDDILAGCVIKSIKKFKIDNEENKINTFYIQEIFINTNYTEKKYEDYLFNYIINKCPDDINYIIGEFI